MSGIEEDEEEMERAAWREEVEMAGVGVDTVGAGAATVVVEEEEQARAALQEAAMACEADAEVRDREAEQRRAAEVGVHAARLVAGSRRAKRERDSRERAWKREAIEAPQRVSRGPPVPLSGGAGGAAAPVVRSRAPLKRARDVYARDESIR